jgi:hypothetical protein
MQANLDLFPNSDTNAHIVPKGKGKDPLHKSSGNVGSRTDDAVSFLFLFLPLLLDFLSRLELPFQSSDLFLMLLSTRLKKKPHWPFTLLPLTQRSRHVF